MIAGAQGGAGALGLLGRWESRLSALLGCLFRLFLLCCIVWVAVALPRGLISCLSVAGLCEQSRIGMDGHQTGFSYQGRCFVLSSLCCSSHLGFRECRCLFCRFLGDYYDSCDISLLNWCWESLIFHCLLLFGFSVIFQEFLVCQMIFCMMFSPVFLNS